MGYAWIFPKKKSANVGVGVNPNVNAKNALDFFIKKYPGMRSLLGKNYSVREKRGGCIPMSGPKNINETVSDGLILVGDAASIVDPVTGEGITPAMLSGISAGEVATIGILKDEWSKNVLSIYDKTWREKKFLGDIPLGEEFDMLKETKELFYNIFTRKDIPKEARRSFISTLSLENEEDILKSIDEIERMIKN
jgi:digeranylgeranylglycerophospholipid reductase